MEGDFDFATNAEAIAGSLLDAIVVDCQIDIEATFGLDLTNVFNDTLDISSRLPDPFLRINTFNVDGEFGFKEWSASLSLGNATFGVAVSFKRYSSV